MKTKHTPTPFRLDAETKMIVLDSSGVVVVHCAGIVDGFENAKRLAAFIVRACNSHEALKEALKALEQFESTPDKDAVLISYKAIERARKALKQAEGK